MDEQGHDALEAALALFLQRHPQAPPFDSRQLKAQRQVLNLVGKERGGDVDDQEEDKEFDPMTSLGNAHLRD